VRQIQAKDLQLLDFICKRRPYPKRHARFRFPSSAACGRFFKAEEHCSEGGLIAAPIISEILRQVGFSRWYDTVEELLQAIVDACSN
jgi:hypothetical protein